MTIKRIKTCTLCNTEFTTPYQRTKYCESCRTTANKKKKVDRRLTVAQSRIQRLSTSDEWVGIARECKRAGTVEILKGVDLEALFALRKARNKTYGYNPNKKTSKYHLCHISPVVGENSVGLLHHLNLFIGTSFHNQLHGNNSHAERGMSIPTNKLQKKWRVDESTKDSAVLSKVVDYLGPTLIEFAKENAINTSSRIGLARWIHQNDPNNILSIKQLEQKTVTQLREVKAAVQEKELYQYDYTARRSVVVALEECQRLSQQLPQGQHQSDLEFMIPVLYVAATWLASLPDQEGLADIFKKPYGVAWKPLELREGMDASTLRDFISFQAFDTLQGAPVDRKMIRSTLSKYLTVTSLSPDYSASNSSMQSHYADEYTRFVHQVPVVKNAIITLGLPDKVMLAEEVLKAQIAHREEEIFASFNYEQCEGPLDYSTIYYDVGDDYVPIKNLRVTPEEIFCDF
jgi:hypothetical protein